VFASVFGKLGPVPYNPSGNPVARAEQKLGDKFRDPYAGLVSPTNVARAEPLGGAAKPEPRDKADTGKQKSETKPGYYTVGDSHGVGIARPKTPWIKMSTTGSSAFDPEHLKNIEKIPPGSVVAISIGANDLGGRKISDIVDQVNKTIRAAQARGLQVVHLLPTSTTDPKLQKKREELRQALLTGQTQAPIVNLGQASKKDPMELHLSPQGYQQVGDSILQSFKPGAEKPVGTLVKPDWSKYNFGDQGILEKIGPGRWRSESGKIFSNAPELEVLPTVTKPETFLDKIQRTLPPALGGKGELVSQVFGDKKKSEPAPVVSTSPNTPPAKSVTKTAEPESDDLAKRVAKGEKSSDIAQNQAAEIQKKIDAGKELEARLQAEYDRQKAELEKIEKDKAKREKQDSGSNWFDKLFGIDQAKKVQAQWAADTERREAERKAKADQKNAPRKNLSGVPADIDYSRNPAAAPKSSVIKKTDPANEPGTP
jgi:hypothetical protein